MGGQIRLSRGGEIGVIDGSELMLGLEVTRRGEAETTVYIPVEYGHRLV